MTHPHNLAAITAVHALREAYGWLEDVIEAEAGGNPTPRPGGTPLDAQAAERRDALLRAEKADRTALTRLGLTDTAASGGVSPMPIRPELLDARATAHATLGQMISVLEYAVDAHPALDHQPAMRTAPTGWTPATQWMLDVLPHVGPWAASAVATALGKADRAVRTAIPERASHEPYSALCPACGGYSLVTETSAPDFRHQTVLCVLTDCRCRGEDCPCGVDEPTPGTAHRWWLTSAPALQLAQVIEEGAAA